MEYVLEPKVDGVSIGVIYRQGRLATGVTRGDGKVGDDITANIRTIRAIPLQLKLKDPPELLEVRGEAFIAIKDFEKLNAELEAAGEAPFPNARNATAGTLKQLDPRIVAKRPFAPFFTPWEFAKGRVLRPMPRRCVISRKPDCQRSLFGGSATESRRFWTATATTLFVITTKRHDLRTKVPYEIDGIVLKVNNLADREKIPSKTRSPGYAIVHKPIPWITPAETVLGTSKCKWAGPAF